MGTLLVRIAIALLMLSSAMGGLQVAGAESRTNGVSEETQTSFVVDGVEGGPSSVVFSRLTIAPGAAARIASVSGESVYFLQSGSWSVRLTAAPPIATPSVAATSVPGSVDGTPIGVGTEETLSAGSHLIVPPQMELQIGNMGKSPAASLVVSVSEHVEGPSGAGVTWQPLADPVSLPEGPIQVDLTHITLDPGTTSKAHRAEGPELLEVVAGPVAVILNPGQLRISRTSGEQETLRAGYEDPMASPDPFLETDGEEGGLGMTTLPPGTPLPGTVAGLNTGDAAVLKAGGSRVLRSGDESPAEIVVVGLRVTETDVPATPLP